ncbi:MAG: hypothetical protein LBQ37_02360 [Elusimicrobiota bacterium]|jgi:hypothetical protein|nr:hypothetical protein [Elusimicrobiota bacterium]
MYLKPVIKNGRIFFLLNDDLKKSENADTHLVIIYDVIDNMITVSHKMTQLQKNLQQKYLTALLARIVNKGEVFTGNISEHKELKFNFLSTDLYFVITDKGNIGGHCTHADGGYWVYKNKILPNEAIIRVVIVSNPDTVDFILDQMEQLSLNSNIDFETEENDEKEFYENFYSDPENI